jgi:hypothetical protein
MSAAYFRSEWCRREWHEFCRQEEVSLQLNRIFPVYLEADEAFEDEGQWDDWRRDLQRRQHVDLRPWCPQRRRLGGVLAWFRRRAPSTAWGDPELRRRVEELERHAHDRWLEVTLRSGALRPGVAYQSIPLPRHVVSRREEMGRLKEDVLRNDKGPGVVVSAVFGLGGVGKSTLAAALVQDAEVRGRFADGIL